MVIFWIPALIFFYRKLWKGTEDKLKIASKIKKIEIIRAVGFLKYVFIQGILLGNGVAILTTLINIFGNKITLAKFIDIYLTDLAIGLLAGIILWFIATRKPKEV